MKHILLPLILLGGTCLAQTNGPALTPSSTNAADAAALTAQSQTPAFTAPEPSQPAPNSGPAAVLPSAAWMAPAGSRQIRGIQGGAMASYGAHTVHFALNANTVGAVSIQAHSRPVDPPLRAHVIGLCYWSLVTGNSAMISDIQDASGQILPPSRVLYRRALGGEHDLLYAYEDESLEQFVVLHRRLPAPQTVLNGADPSQVWVGVVSEVVDPPEPVRRGHPVTMQSAAPSAPASLLPGEDIYLYSGALHVLGEGRAFVLGSNGPQIPTATAWHTVPAENGQATRYFLIDFVPYLSLQAEIEALPPGALRAGGASHPSLKAMLAASSQPRPRSGGAASMLLASAGTEPEPGVAIDYTVVTTHLLNVSFGAGAAKSGYAAFGQNAADFWNLVNPSGASSVAMANLAWSDTNNSGAGLILTNIGGTGSNGVATDPMYGAYVIPATNGSLVLQLTNLPANTYNLYLYGHGSNLLSSSTFYLYVGGVSQAVKYTVSGG